MDIVGIYNLALGATGSEELISSPSESSRAAELCNLWYEPVRDQVLRAAYWPATKKNVRLAVLAERDPDTSWVVGAPDPGWRFLYAAPTDMLAPRFLSDYTRFELTVSSANAKAIVANTEEAILEYTFKQENPNIWDPALRMAIVYALAANMTMPLTGKVDRAKWNAQLANNLVFEARSSSANTNENKVDSAPDWILARGYAEVTPPTRFIYPLGPMLALSGSGVPVT